VLPQQAKTNLNNSINDKANGGHKWNPRIRPREQREKSGIKNPILISIIKFSLEKKIKDSETARIKLY